MHLFKSQCLHEPPRAASASYRDLAFGHRHGRRRDSGRTSREAGNDDGDLTREAGRELLRRMADYDCAA